MNNFYGMIMLAEEATEKSSLFSADQMGGYAATILITIFNVAIAYIFIKFVIFKRILKIIKNREELIASRIDDAEKAKAEAEANAETSKQTIADARVEASKILEDARIDAQKQSEIITKKASDEAAEIIARAENEVIRMKKVAIEEMKDEISDLSVEVAGKVIGDVVEHDKLKDLAVKHTEALVGGEVGTLVE